MADTETDAPKTKKIVDITGPNESAPSSTSRPILITHHPMLTTDPMMSTQSVKPSEIGSSPTKPAVVRQEKVIARPTEQAGSATRTNETDPSTKAIETKETAQPELTEQATDTTNQDTTSTSADMDTSEGSKSDARKVADDAAAAEERRLQLEEIITAGTYAVPINAVGRRRSHMVVVELVVIALVVLLGTLDVMLDSGVITIPVVPHTHFSKH